MPEDKLKKFHDSIKNNPNIVGVPEDYNKFQTALKNPEKAQSFFKAISENKSIVGLPDNYNSFASSLGLVEKKNPNEKSLASSGTASSTESGKTAQRPNFVSPRSEPQSQFSDLGALNKEVVAKVTENAKKVQIQKEKGSQVLERTGSALSTLGKSFIDGIFATSSEQVAILAKNIDDEGRELVGLAPLKKPIEEYQTYKWAKSIMASTEETFKPNPEFKGEVQEQVAQTAGDLLGLVASAFITKNPSSALSKLGTKGLIKAMGNASTRKMVTKEIAKESIKMIASPTGFLGAAQTGTKNYDEAKAKGATDDEANAMYWSTAITGAVANSLPIGGLLNRFDKASGGKMKQMVVGGLVGGVEEAVTEGIEQISANFAAQNIYDETRKLFEGVGESTTMGGGLGFVLNAFGVKLGSIRNKYKDNPQKLAEIDESIEYVKNIAEKEAQTSAVKLSKEEQIKVDKYSKIIEDPTISNEVKDIARDNLMKITGSKIIEAEVTQDKLNNLSEDQQLDIKLIDAEIDRIKEASVNDVDIKDELEATITDLTIRKNEIINSPTIVETVNDEPSATEVSTERVLSEREQQMATVPKDTSIEVPFINKAIDKASESKIGGIVKAVKKLFTTGDLNAVRAKEIVDAETGATVDKVRSISTKIQKLIGKDKKSRELANTVMSVDRLDDKVSKLALNDNYTAISEIIDGKYSPDQIKQAVDFYKGNQEEGTSTMTKDVFDDIIKTVSGISANRVSEKRTENAEKVKSLVGKILNFDTVGKTKEVITENPTLIIGGQSPMLTGSEVATSGVKPSTKAGSIDVSTNKEVTLESLRAELSSLPNGEKILAVVDESMANNKKAIAELSKSANGKKILQQAKEARGIIDSFSDWVSSSDAAKKINEKVGEIIAGNRGSYLKRSFRYWKDKKFEPSEAMKNVALESVVEDMMVVELTRLEKSKEYNRLEGDAKLAYLNQISDDVRRKAKIELDTYLDEIREKREGGSGFLPNSKIEKVNDKVISFRKLIDESFLNLLGNINDPISQFHDTVLAQAQIKSAANFHWILNEVTGKENIFDSREQVVEFNGNSEGFKKINDANSVLDGKWVSTDIYDVISSAAPNKEGTGFHIYRKVLSTMRKSKTIYNFFAGWTTNLIGGEVTLGANGIINNPKEIGKYLLNRAKYVNNPEGLDADIQKDIDAMKENGFWNTSVSAATIRLLDDNYMDMTSYDRGDEFTRSATKRWIDKAKRFDDNVIRNYSVIDDFTKLVFFRAKKDVFSRKLYGKSFDSLTKAEQNIVHANVSERGKENIATMSRLPRIYHKIAKYPLGDFMAFRISAVKSGVNTITNAFSDINQYRNKELSKEQRNAYLEDGSKTIAGMLAASALNSSFYGTMATLAMGLLSKEDKEVFKDVIDESGVNYGSKSDVYTDFKGTPSVNPQWMRGKNNIVVKDNGKGDIELLNISNKDPYDELFGLFIPRKGTDIAETYSGILKETFSPNMTINLFQNIIKGKDQWGRDIYSGDDNTIERIAKVSGYVITESLVPPAIKNTAKETYKEIQQSKAVEGEDKKDIKKKPVGGGEYFNALLKNTPMLLNRTYKVNLAEQFGYYAKEFYLDRPEKFDDLDKIGKENRYSDLERIRDGYNYLKRYSIVNNNPDFLETATEQMLKSARGISDEEKNYILYGEKSY